ncbi:MAG TPA: hypothetical protein VIE43_21890, partial [Thermoanaerobaculia bacterium]|nr:hypothetical protein [Thermoanaerobaculia bacterium]
MLTISSTRSAPSSSSIKVNRAEVSRTYLLRATLSVLLTVLEQAIQKPFSLPRPAKSLQGIDGDRDDADDVSVIQPDQAVPLFDVMPFP